MAMSASSGSTSDVIGWPRSMATSTPVSTISRSTDRLPSPRRRSDASRGDLRPSDHREDARREYDEGPRRSPAAGVMVATTRPRRTTVKVSPRCSTAFQQIGESLGSLCRADFAHNPIIGFIGLNVNLRRCGTAMCSASSVASARVVRTGTHGAAGGGPPFDALALIPRRESNAIEILARRRTRRGRYVGTSPPRTWRRCSG